jgi:uncharacterized protein
MTGRELAWRILASELLASSAEERGTGEKSPSYVISPLGARMNRVLLTGTITTEVSGTGSAAGFVQARLTDPTGTVPVSTGSYQPQGQADLTKISRPTRVFVVGKAASFRGTGPDSRVTIRAEAVHPVSENEYWALAVEAAVQTLERLELVHRLRSAEPPSDAQLVRAGISPHWIKGARASIDRYPSLDPLPYYDVLRAVLRAVRTSPGVENAPEVERPVGSSPEVVRVVHARSPAPAATPPVGVRALEGRILEILDQLADESPDGYADMDELAERAARHGIEGERMEELLNYLSENGTVEEPLVGKFRRAEGPPRD